MTNLTSDSNCTHWTAGYCDHPDTPECTRCIGYEDCALFVDATDAPFYDSPAFTDYPGELDE